MKKCPTGGRLLPWRPTMVWRFSCRLYCEPGWRVCRKLTRAGARCLWGGGVVLKRAARAPRHASCGLLRPYKQHCTDGRILSFGARPWCNVTATASNAGCGVRSKRTRAGSSCLWGGGAARKLSARARAALVGLGTNEQRYAAGRLLLFVPCPWCGVPPAASETKADAAWEASACALALAVSGEVAQHSSSSGVRASPLWLWLA